LKREVIDGDAFREWYRAKASVKKVEWSTFVNVIWYELQSEVRDTLCWQSGVVG